MEKESMKAYLCAMKNTRVRVAGRNPLTFTVNGCEDLQEFRERLFNAQFDALGYCAGVLDGGAANAGTIRVLRAMLKGVRDTILLDKQGRPHRPLLHVEEGGEKNLRARPRLAAGLRALPRRANRIAGTGAGRVGGKLPESDFPFRFTGSRSELVRFVRALFITGRIVPVGGAKMLRCVRHLLWLLHVPEGPNLSNVINKLTMTEHQLSFFDQFRTLLEKSIFSGR